MELFEALDILIAIAENMKHSSIQEAIETVKLHKQELESPSPIQVVLITEGGVIQESYSNVPTEITVLDGDIEGATDESCRCIDAMDGNEYHIGSFDSYTDPTLVADILKEAFA